MASRIFVQEAIADNFIAELKAAFETASSQGMGDPTNGKTFIGPVADKAQFDRVTSFLDIGTKEAKLVTGGSDPTTGLFIAPTIFADVSPSSTINQGEVFGPVVSICRFKTEEEAIELANDTEYGLSACVYTKSINRALRVTRQLEAGTVAVNDWYFPETGSPLGGIKQSGYGREGGIEGLDEYLQTKTIQIT